MRTMRWEILIWCWPIISSISRNRCITITSMSPPPCTPFQRSGVRTDASQFPDVNVQEVRQLIRNARKEAEGNKPPKSARALYKLIYAMVLPPIVLEATEEKNDEE